MISALNWGHLQPPTANTFPMHFYNRVGHTSTLAVFAIALFAGFLLRPRWRVIGASGIVLCLFIGLATLNRFFWPAAAAMLLVALFPLYRRHLLLALLALPWWARPASARSSSARVCVGRVRRRRAPCCASARSGDRRSSGLRAGRFPLSATRSRPTRVRNFGRFTCARPSATRGSGWASASRCRVSSISSEMPQACWRSNRKR